MKPPLVKRSFAAAMLSPTALAAGLNSFVPQASYTNATFSDVPANAWYAENVASAYKLGLMQGSGAGQFNPSGRLTVGGECWLWSAAYMRSTIPARPPSRQALPGTLSRLTMPYRKALSKMQTRSTATHLQPVRSLQQLCRRLCLMRHWLHATILPMVQSRMCPWALQMPTQATVSTAPVC